MIEDDENDKSPRAFIVPTSNVCRNVRKCSRLRFTVISSDDKSRAFKNKRKAYKYALKKYGNVWVSPSAHHSALEVKRMFPL